MRVLITGGYGNLGSWLARRLIDNGHEITILSRSKKGFLDHLPHRFIACDIANGAAFEEVASGQFDAIVHAASQNDFFIEDYARKALLINALGTRNLLQAIADAPPKHFIYFSTFHVYGAADGNIDETAPTNPRNDYASTHLFAEEYVKQFNRTAGVGFDIIRLTNSYGCPLDRNTTKWYLVLNDLAKMAYERQEIVLNSNGKAQRDFIWMGDVASAVDQLISRPAATNTTYNLSSENTYQVLEIAQAVQRAYSERFGTNLPIKINEQDTNEYSKVLQVSSTKLRKVVELNSEPHFFEEAQKIFKLLQDQA